MCCWACGATFQKSWWNLSSSEGTPKAAQGLQGNSVESLLHPSLEKPAKTFRTPFGIAGWLLTSPSLQGRALLQIGKVTMPSPRGLGVFLSLSKDSGCSKVIGAGYSVLAEICRIPYTAVMRGML